MSAFELYGTVIDDVIAGVRNSFLDEGVDEDVLQELKRLWKAKLAASRAVDPPRPGVVPVDPPRPGVVPVDPPQPGVVPVDPPQPGVVPVDPPQPGVVPVDPPQPGVVTVSPPPALQNVPQASGSNIIQMAFDMAQGSSQDSGVQQGAPPPSLPGNHELVLDPNNTLVPAKFTLSGLPRSQPLSFIIQIPVSAIDVNKLQQVLTVQIITTIMSLPEPLAAAMMQRHINSTLGGQQNVFHGSGCSSSSAMQISLDGGLDYSDDESSNTGDSSENEASEEDMTGINDEDEEYAEYEERAEEREEEREESVAVEEEPLNSDDDILSDDEPDTENIVVCQYEKITHKRNKWKLHLKNCIITISGRDYVFDKAVGNAKW